MQVLPCSVEVIREKQEAAFAEPNARHGRIASRRPNGQDQVSTRRIGTPAQAGGSRSVPTLTKAIRSIIVLLR